MKLLIGPIILLIVGLSCTNFDSSQVIELNSTNFLKINEVEAGHPGLKRTEIETLENKYLKSSSSFTGYLFAITESPNRITIVTHSQKNADSFVVLCEPTITPEQWLSLRRKQTVEI